MVSFARPPINMRADAGTPLPKQPSPAELRPAAAKAPAFWPRARRHLAGADAVMATIISTVHGAALRPRDDAFFSLARSIVGQQISVHAAQSIWQKLCDGVGEISPPVIAGAGEARLRACGLTRQKSRSLVDLSARFMDGSVDVGHWRGLDDEAVIAELTRVKGIGRWTAEMFLIFHLLRPDVLPMGDLGFKRAMRAHYNRGAPLSDDRIRELAEPWRPWRSVAVWYLWRSLDATPVDY